VAPSNSTSAVTTTATPPPKDISQREHSFRCYSTALVLYNSKQWGLVEEHIYFNLARQSYHLSRVAQSLLFFIRLLSATSQQSAVHHRSYIREFVFIYQVKIKKKEIKEQKSSVLCLFFVSTMSITSSSS